MPNTPQIYIDAHRLASEIREAYMQHAYHDPRMSRHLSEIEQELDDAVKNCNLTLTAIDALRELIKARKIGLAMTEDNMSIAMALARIEEK